MILDPAVNSLDRQHATIARTAEDEIASIQVGKTFLRRGRAVGRRRLDDRDHGGRPDHAGSATDVFNPGPKSICQIAFGMGSSYRSGLIAGLNVEGVESCPRSRACSAYYYPDASQVLADANGRLLVADGRNHIELTSHNLRPRDGRSRRPPFEARAPGCSTRGVLQGGQGHLNPGGVMMEWMPYDQSVDEFRAHAQTFHSVFANDIFVFGPAGFGVYMLGSEAPLEFTVENVRSILSRPGVTADLASAPDAPIASLDPQAWTDLIMAQIWIKGDQVQKFAGDAPLITDDRPYTEYYLVRETLANLFGPRSPRMGRESLKAATPAG